MNGTNWYCIHWDIPERYGTARKEQRPWIMEAFTAEDAVTQFRIKLHREWDHAAHILSVGPATLQQIIQWHHEHGKPL